MTDISKAARDAVEAQANSEQVAMVMAILQAQQLTQQQGCQHPPAPVQQQSSNGKWIAIGVAAPFVLVSFAVASIAVAISVVALTICCLVLRSMWNDQKGRKS